MILCHAKPVATKDVTSIAKIDKINPTVETQSYLLATFLTFSYPLMPASPSIPTSNWTSRLVSIMGGDAILAIAATHASSGCSMKV